VKIKDKAVLATPRSLRCEYCDRLCGHDTERHHIVFRGIGGGKRLDIVENVVDLGGPWDCGCHQKADARKITSDELYAIVAKRLGTTARKIKNKIKRLLAMDKWGRKP
jgi:hypothetical protein